jgi:CubicO group peptidase (beta-lactamase class C family)
MPCRTGNAILDNAQTRMPEDNTVPIHGTVASGFDRVREVFRANFAARDELGAACAAYYRGELVVDLWGGHQDIAHTAPWTEDTLVLMFSATKGVASAAMAHAHAQGLFAYDDPVAAHWPAFGQSGKEDITIRELLAHQAGVAAIDVTLTPERIADRAGLMAQLAGKTPDWTPGTRHGYHAWSLGWYESELLRHADPHGRTLGTYFAEEIAAPLDLAFHIGLPPHIEDARVTAIQGFRPIQMVTSIGQFPWRMVAALVNPWSVTTRALSPFDMRTPAELNDPAYRTLEIPGGNGIGQVRDVAKLYGLLAADPSAVGVDASTIAQLSAPPTPPEAGQYDVVLKTDTAYALGYWKAFEDFPFGSPQAFGAPGAGGAFAFADPARQLGFAYAPNRMGTALWDDPREVALRHAVLQGVDAR